MFPIFGAILVFVGAILFIVAIFAKDKLAGTMLANPWFAVVVAGALVLLGGMPLGGFTQIQDWTEGQTTQVIIETEDGYQYADFEIDLTVAASEGTLSSDETTITVPAYGNQSGYTLLQTDNSTAFVDPDLTFVIEPDTWAGATNDDLATIYYEVRNPDLTIDSSDDTYYLITKSGGYRQAIWDEGGQTNYVSGKSTMGLTSTATVYLNFTINEASFAHMDEVFDPITVYIDFYNGDHSFSQTFKVQFMLTDIWS